MLSRKQSLREVYMPTRYIPSREPMDKDILCVVNSLHTQFDHPPYRGALHMQVRWQWLVAMHLANSHHMEHG